MYVQALQSTAAHRGGGSGGEGSRGDEGECGDDVGISVECGDDTEEISVEDVARLMLWHRRRGRRQGGLGARLGCTH